MRKFVAMLLSAAMMTLWLSACASSGGTSAPDTPEAQPPGTAEQTDAPEAPAPAGEAVELVLWHELEPAAVEVLESVFAELQPEIVVTLERKKDLSNTLRTVATDPNAVPDLVWTPHDQIGSLAATGAIEPLDGILTDEELAQFMDFTLDAASYNGKLYQIPVYFECLMFLYNKDLMEAPPESTEALLAYMQENTTDDHFGYIECHKDLYYVAAWIQAFGGEILSTDGVPGLNSAETKAAVDYHLKFVEYMQGNGEYDTMNALFLEGSADAVICGPWFIGGAKDAGINIGAAAMPVATPTGVPLSPFAGIQGIELTAAGQNKEAAKEVIKFLAGPELGIGLALRTGSPPANLLAYENAEVSGDEIIGTMRAVAENCFPMPNIPEMSVIWGVMEEALISINLQGADVSATLDEAQKKAEQLIQDMR